MLSGYTADLGLLDFDAELGAVPKKKKKKRKIGAKIKKGLKKVGKGLAVVATGGLAAAAIKKKGAIKKALSKTKVAKALKKGAAAVGLTVKKKAAPKKRPVAKKAAKTIAAVKSATAADCSSKSDLAKLVTAQLTATLAPKINQANDLLAKFDVQRMATSEHRRLMTDQDFRREVLSLLALNVAKGNVSARNAARIILQRGA